MQVLLLALGRQVPVQVLAARVLAQVPLLLLPPRLQPVQHGRSPRAPAGFCVSVAWFKSNCYTSLADEEFQLRFQLS